MRVYNLKKQESENIENFYKKEIQDISIGDLCIHNPDVKRVNPVVCHREGHKGEPFLLHVTNVRMGGSINTISAKEIGGISSRGSYQFTTSELLFI